MTPLSEFFRRCGMARAARRNSAPPVFFLRMALDLRNIFPPRREICEVRFLSAVLQRKKPANDGGSKKIGGERFPSPAAKHFGKAGESIARGKRGDFATH